DLLVNPRLEPWPRPPEELQGDVHVLAGHPSRPREPAPPGLDRSIDFLDRCICHDERHEQSQRLRLGAVRAITRHVRPSDRTRATVALRDAGEPGRGPPVVTTGSPGRARP